MNSLEMALGCLLVCCLVATTVEYQRQIKSGHMDDPLQQVQQGSPPPGFGPADPAKPLEIDMVYPIALSGAVLHTRVFLKADFKQWRQNASKTSANPNSSTRKGGLDRDCDCPEWEAKAQPLGVPQAKLAPRHDGISLGGGGFSLTPR